METRPPATTSAASAASATSPEARPPEAGTGATASLAERWTLTSGRIVLSGTQAIAACGAANVLNCKKTVNLGSATIRGFEAWGRWQVVSGQWLTSGLSALRGDNDDLDEPLYQMPADEMTFGWIGNILPGVKADFTLRLVDRQDRVATVFTKGAENATSGFATADLGATWQIDRRNSIRAALRNIADKAYHEHLTEGVSGQEIRAPGRSLQLVWRGSF